MTAVGVYLVFIYIDWVKVTNARDYTYCAIFIICFERVFRVSSTTVYLFARVSLAACWRILTMTILFFLPRIKNIFEHHSDLHNSYHPNEPWTLSARLNLSGNSNRSNIEVRSVPNPVNRQVLCDSSSESDGEDDNN